MKKETFNVIDYSEFEKLVNDNFPQYKGEYNFVEDIECSNDIDKAFYATPKLDEFQLQDIESMSIYAAPALLNSLCQKGVLEEGNYLIQVCW
jgi:hypothetical protein